jgi:hypothetical protein
MAALLARIADTDTRGACNMSFWTAAAKRSDIKFPDPRIVSRTVGSSARGWRRRRDPGNAIACIPRVQ